jgi:inosine-uridine nucleoside N-ribohydrolase
LLRPGKVALLKTKVLFDTDIGSDIDDAVALSYLLAQPDCDLVGITTVTGEPAKRAMLTNAILRHWGRDVPIFPGAADPLLVPQAQTTAPQAAALGKWDHAADFPRGEAVEFLRRTIRAHPGEVVLLAVGPLTNAGLLFAVDPETASMLKALVMMAGSFTDAAGAGRRLEWNARGDPHATAVVYRAPVGVHRSVGLDVTMRVRMKAADVRERFGAIPLLAPVLDMAEVWFRKRDVMTFHDPLAAASIFAEDLVTFERGNVEVELADPKLLGATRWRTGGRNPRHEVALDVDPARFFEHFFSVF